MKILFTLTPSFNPHSGGVQQTTYKLGKFFTEAGHEVHYFSMADTGNEIAKYGTLHTASKPGGQNNRDNNKQLMQVISQVQPDIVINQMPYEENMRETLYQAKQKHEFLLLGCLRNSLFSVKNNLDAYAQSIFPSALQPLVLNKAGKRMLLSLHRKRHRNQLKNIIDRHDYFILLTPSNEEELTWFVDDYDKNKVHAIPNSIPEIKAPKQNYEKVILHVGRLNSGQKRSDLLLPVWKKLYPQLPDWKFVVVGDGPYKEVMEDEIKKENIPRVELAGKQDPGPYYESASLFLMTSAFEGFPNVLLEAQSYGLVPFVFNSYPAVSWLVNHKQNGYLIPSFNCEAMAQEVLSLVNNNPEHFFSISKEAQNNASRFTIEQVGRQWLELFDAHVKHEAIN